MFISMQISANDSTGFVATGGVQYLKNPKISMQSEDLFISKNIIRVNYQFKNLTTQDITELFYFPCRVWAVRVKAILRIPNN